MIIEGYVEKDDLKKYIHPDGQGLKALLFVYEQPFNSRRRVIMHIQDEPEPELNPHVPEPIRTILNRFYDDIRKLGA